MKRLTILLLLTVTFIMSGYAQNYNLRVAGQGNDGNYYVKVTTVLDKKQNKEALEYLRKLSVDGIMFRGAAGVNGYPAIEPIVKDPATAQLKAEFFTAFNNEGRYNNFVTLNDESVVVTQLPKKKFEVTAIATIRKEALIKYLQDHQIIKGFDSLW